MVLQHAHPVDPERVARAQQRGISAEDATRLSSLLIAAGGPGPDRGSCTRWTWSRSCASVTWRSRWTSARTAVSYALRMLRTAGFVQTRRQGRVVFYRLADRFPEPLLEHCLRELISLSRVASGGGGLRDDRPRVGMAGGHMDHGGHGDHAEPSSATASGGACCWPLPVVASTQHVRRPARLHDAAPGTGWISPVLGTVVFLYGGLAVPDRRGRRGPGPAARDDAADRAGDHGRVRRERRHLARPRRARPRLLVGAGARWS